MLKKNLGKGFMVLLTFAVGAVVAQARDPLQPKFDVFVLGGGSTFVDPHNFASADHLFHSRFEVGPKFTFGVAAPYGKLLTIETAYSFGPNDLVVTDTNIFPHVGRLYPVRTSSGSLAAVVHAPALLFKVRPYAEGGVEYDRFSPTAAAISTAKNEGFGAVSTANITYNDKFGVNVGGGLDRKLMKRLTFRIDLRDHITSSPAFGLPSRPGFDNGAIFPVPGRAHNIQYTAGILFHVGKL